MRVHLMMIDLPISNLRGKHRTKALWFLLASMPGVGMPSGGRSTSGFRLTERVTSALLETARPAVAAEGLALSGFAFARPKGLLARS